MGGNYSTEVGTDVNWSLEEAKEKVKNAETKEDLIRIAKDHGLNTTKISNLDDIQNIQSIANKETGHKGGKKKKQLAEYIIKRLKELKKFEFPEVKEMEGPYKGAGGYQNMKF